MPIFILLVGALLVVAGVNNKLGELGALVKEDFQPTDSTPGFHIWIVAIFVSGSLGYVRSLRPVANAFLVLIMVSLILSNKGFFAKFTQALEAK